ncbi:hypothetical protein [Pseudoalteromonas sp. McH1-42]|uniref:hypothetical protein n=1 Tax=Pseudoalteromonas sp. McH1-42 TaxID=2917752 RepID=UPI001EF751B0|nr:hypothetical protein [Pseudoalteromonas sp. McH1-42]MCG7561323.1 hypothetical protein [Pseudoalteromonas sp. McH1-42]
MKLASFKFAFGISLLFFNAFAFAEGWTVATRITSVGQYGANSTFFTTEADVSQCGNKKKLFFLTSDATEPDKFYSTLLMAYASGKRMKVYLHDPVVCGSENAQKINIANYFYVFD